MLADQLRAVIRSITGQPSKGEFSTSQLKGRFEYKADILALALDNILVTNKSEIRDLIEDLKCSDISPVTISYVVASLYQYIDNLDNVSFYYRLPVINGKAVKDILPIKLKYDINHDIKVAFNCQDITTLKRYKYQLFNDDSRLSEWLTLAKDKPLVIKFLTEFKSQDLQDDLSRDEYSLYKQWVQSHDIKQTFINKQTTEKRQLARFMLEWKNLFNVNDKAVWILPQVEQLRSLDQYQDRSLSLACGFFVIYNVMKLFNLYKANGDNIDSILKDYLLSAGKTLGDWSELNGLYQTWSTIITAHPEAGSYEQSNQSEEAELSNIHLHLLLKDADYKESVTILYSDLQGPNLDNIYQIFDNALYYGQDVLTKISKWRLNHKPLALIYLQKGHWKLLFLTDKAYVMNSYANADNCNDYITRKLHGFCLSGNLNANI